MKTFIIVMFCVAIVALVWIVLTKKYRSPYKLIMIFGKKRSGKTTLLTKLAIKYHKKGWTVYSTVKVPYAYKIEYSQIGDVAFKEHSIVLLDEVSLIWSNRDFKQFRRSVESFFRLQGHYKLRIYLFSQTFDIDLKLRNLTDEMYLIRNVFGVFSYGKRINKKIVLTEAEADRPSHIAENLVFDSLLLFWAGSRFFTYIPKYAKYFDSFEAPPLKEVDFEKYELPASLRGGRSRNGSFIVSCFKPRRKSRFRHR